MDFWGAGTWGLFQGSVGFFLESFPIWPGKSRLVQETTNRDFMIPHQLNSFLSMYMTVDVLIVDGQSRH